MHNHSLRELRPRDDVDALYRPFVPAPDLAPGWRRHEETGEPRYSSRWLADANNPRPLHDPAHT